MAVCTLLWRDLTDANHDERHQAAAGAGRRCCCPLWMPSNRREWDEELEVLERKYGIGLRELAEVLDVAFRRSDTGISISDGNLLKLVYNHNWLWYSRTWCQLTGPTCADLCLVSAEIVQLALTRRAYSVVTSRAVLDALFKYQTVRRDLFQHERRKLQRRRDQEAQAARERARLPDIEFHQDLLAFEVKAEEE
jgi:NACalpha-BTF3-like transcription factor